MLAFLDLAGFDELLLFNSDTFQQNACRFIVRILRDKLALHRFLQDRLFQCFGEGSVEGSDVFFCLAVSFDVWEEFFYLGYYAVLFGERWQRN